MSVRSSRVVTALVSLTLVAAQESRVSKLLNVFNIITFPNDPCNNGNVYGSCYTATECASLGGTTLGTCASGFGVCCTITGGCGASSSVNNSYFSSASGDSSPCSFTVCKSEANICQIRLDFDTFVTESPSTAVNSPLTTVATGRTQCLESQFWITSDAGSSPTICGENTGYHMIVTARDDCNVLNHYWTTGTPSYSIRVSQISCTAPWRPHTDCLQWFTGTSGYIYSYNYNGGYHLADQHYSNCIRTEQGYCSISYAAVSTSSFSLSGTTGTTYTAVSGVSCSQDYLIIQQGGACPAPTTTSTTIERFCGNLLAPPGAGTTAASVCTYKQPFIVGVSFDGSEVDSAPQAEASAGFYIYYEQVAC